MTRKKQRASPKVTDDINDKRVMGYLLSFFGGAVAISLIAWLLTNIGFKHPWLPWEESLLGWLDSFFQNFGTEMFGAFLTFYLIEVLLRKRRSREAEEEAKNRELFTLGIQASSISNQHALVAIDTLREMGQLREGILRRIYDLEQVNWQNADLTGADLHNTNMSRANLKGANLNHANLQQVTMFGSDLQEASLIGANLEGAHLDVVSLQDADFHLANLRGCSVPLDRLKEVRDLSGAILPDGTILPGRDPIARRNAPWNKEFKQWCETVETNEEGIISISDKNEIDKGDEVFKLEF